MQRRQFLATIPAMATVPLLGIPKPAESSEIANRWGAAGLLDYDSEPLTFKLEYRQDVTRVYDPPPNQYWQQFVAGKRYGRITWRWLTDPEYCLDVPEEAAQFRTKLLNLHYYLAKLRVHRVHQGASEQVELLESCMHTLHTYYLQPPLSA